MTKYNGRISIDLEFDDTDEKTLRMAEALSRACTFMMDYGRSSGGASHSNIDLHQFYQDMINKSKGPSGKI